MILAAIDSRLVTALVVAGGLALFGLLLLLTSASELRGRRRAKVPAAFRPMASDEELERNVLPSIQRVGVVAIMLMALWLPAYWIYQPSFLESRRATLEHFDVYGHEAAAERSGGAQLYADFCASCHGKNGEGGVTQYVIYGENRQYPEPPLQIIYARYQAAGRSEEEVTRLVRDAIERGRPGTPMPTWGFAFGGPLNSYQVDNLVKYIKTLQVPLEDIEKPEKPLDGEALYAANCALCHGDEGQGGIGPNLQVALERYDRETLFEVIHDGRLNINRPSMPSWAYLGEDAIDALLDFIESIQRS